jgi:hypothetical protein
MKNKGPTATWSNFQFEVSSYQAKEVLEFSQPERTLALIDLSFIGSWGIQDQALGHA